MSEIRRSQPVTQFVLLLPGAGFDLGTVVPLGEEAEDDPPAPAVLLVLVLVPVEVEYRLCLHWLWLCRKSDRLRLAWCM